MPSPSHSLIWDVLELALGVPFIFFLPGYFSLRTASGPLFPAQTGQHERLGALEEAFLSVVLSLTLASWFALLLAEVGFFEVELLIGLLMLTTLGFWLLSGSRPQGRVGRRPRTWVSALALAALLCLASALFTPPSQTILWGSDSTAYINFGVKISETGAFLFTDDLLDGMPQPAREELFLNRLEDDLTGEYARFPGGFSIPDITESKVAAGFSPLFPVWIAVFHQLFGLPAAFLVSLMFAILGVGAVFLVGKHLQGTTAGLFAGLLLLACLPQIWFARAPMSEVVSQFFVFAGLLVLLRYLDTESSFFSVAAGLILGMAIFVRFDLIPVLALSIIGVAAYLLFSRREIAHYEYFLAGFGFLLLHSLVHLTVFPSNYDELLRKRLNSLFELVGPPSFFDQAPHALLSMLLLGAALVVAGAVVLYPRSRFFRGPRPLAWALTVGSVLYMLAYWLASPSRLNVTVRWLGWYLSWPLLAAFAVGLVAIVAIRVVQQRDLKTLTISILLTVTCMHYLYNPQEQLVGSHIWTIRRFVPVVIPGIFLVLSVSAVFLCERSWRRHGRWLAPAVMLPFLALVLSPSLAIVNEPLWPNGLRESQAIADQFPENAVVLVGRELAGTHVQMSLSYAHGKDSVLLQGPSPDSRILQDQVEAWLREGREVFLLVAQSDTHFHAPRLTLRPQGTHYLDLPVLETTRSRVPQQVVSRSVDMQAFRAQINEQGPKSSIDVGTYADDALFVLNGFHGPESSAADGLTFRWTTGTASIEIPESERITLMLGGGRPGGAPPAEVRIWLDGQLLIDGLVVPDISTEVTISTPTAGTGDAATARPGGGLTQVRLESSTFNSKALGISDDERDLGVRVYRVGFE